MTPYTIKIPDNATDVQMQPGDTLTIVFDETAFFWNTDPGEFNPSLNVDVYKSGDTVTVTAGQNPETVVYGWLALVPGPSTSASLRAGGKGAKQGSGGHTIQVGSGLEPTLESTLKKDKELCKCWPCVADLIELLLKQPFPKAIKLFLQTLLSVGNKLCHQG